MILRVNNKLYTMVSEEPSYDRYIVKGSRQYIDTSLLYVCYPMDERDWTNFDLYYFYKNKFYIIIETKYIGFGTLEHTLQRIYINDYKLIKFGCKLEKI